MKGDGVNVMVADPGPQVEDKDAGATPASALFWDRRYLEGRDGWDLGKPAPPLQEFLTHHPLGPQPPGRVLVPGCGRGHEARLLAELGFAVVGLDFSAEAIAAARQVAAPPGANLRWLQANLFDGQALAAAGLGPASLRGLFWCHGRPAGPPYGSDPGELAGALAEAGLLQALWQPAPYGATGPQQHPRDNEWLGLWHKPPSP